ncbi:hypothetical protein [Consotaella aegiceratis]|uniref:hypothetical protein n=1 Tax=Consotaella aegiceratis TaxID=3097961 RepID=UPI002F3F61EC
MFETPSPDSVATLCLVLGLLFLLRCGLVLRRLMDGGQKHGRGLWQRITKAGGFGADNEPERRLAARQLYIAVVLLSAGLVLFGWRLATGEAIAIAL